MNYGHAILMIDNLFIAIRAGFVYRVYLYGWFRFKTRVDNGPMTIAVDKSLI